MSSDYLKWSTASLTYSIDWTGGYLLNDAITSSLWAVEPTESIDADNRLETVTTQQTGNICSITVTGGVPGHVYRLVNTIGLASGQSDSRSITLRIGAR